MNGSTRARLTILVEPNDDSPPFALLVPSAQLTTKTYPTDEFNEGWRALADPIRQARPLTAKLEIAMSPTHRGTYWYVQRYMGRPGAIRQLQRAARHAWRRFR